MIIVSPSQNTAYLCDSAVSDNKTVTVTVYCDSSCATIDQEFYYRIRLSPILCMYMCSWNEREREREREREGGGGEQNIVVSP